MQKKHSCPLFVPGDVEGAITHMNCGVCANYVLNQPSPLDKNCLKHNKLIEWTKKNSEYKM